MRTDSGRAAGLLLLGFFATLFLSSFSLGGSSGGALTSSSPLASETAALDWGSTASAGIFHPLTEEYLRQRAKALPYQISEGLGPQKIKLSRSLAPLELALLPDGGSSFKKRKGASLRGTKEKRGWEPLSEDEYALREKELALKAIEMGAELANSLSMPYFSEGLLWTTQRFNAYRHYLADEYRLHVQLSKDDATLTYKVDY